MIKSIYYKNDLKQLYREPMMLLLFILPLIMAPLFKAILSFGVPIALNYMTFNIALYHSYILSFALLLVPGMLGIVMGFMLLDDKDGRIIELLSITPLGTSGYLFIRLSFVALSSFIYVIYSYLVLQLFLVSIPVFIFISIYLAVFSAIIGLIFINLATDKVKGLTYAKGLNLMLLLILADLLHSPIISFIAGLFPSYWIYKIIESSGSLFSLFMGFIIHGIWIVGLLYITYALKTRH